MPSAGSRARYTTRLSLHSSRITTVSNKGLERTRHCVTEPRRSTQCSTAVEAPSRDEMRRSLVIAVGALLFLGAAPSSVTSPAASRGLYVPPGITPAVDRSRGNGIHDLEYEVD